MLFINGSRVFFANHESLSKASGHASQDSNLLEISITSGYIP